MHFQIWILILPIQILNQQHDAVIILTLYRIYVHKVQQFIFFPFISIILNNIMKFHTKLDITL